MGKKLLVAIFFIGISMAGIIQAEAACTVEGRVVDVYTNSAGATTVWVSTLMGTASQVWYAFNVPSTMSHNVLNTINAALISDKTIYIEGNATTCPTAGAYRAAGTVVFAEVF